MGPTRWRRFLVFIDRKKRPVGHFFMLCGQGLACAIGGGGFAESLVPRPEFVVAVGFGHPHGLRLVRVADQFGGFALFAPCQGHVSDLLDAAANGTVGLFAI